MEWGTVVAVIALILSQLPPIRDLLKGTKLRLAVPERFTLWHFLGNINITIPLLIQNIGGGSVNIARIDCVIRDADGTHVWDLPAQNFYYPIRPDQGFLAGPILLKPNEQWSGNVHCFRTWSEADEESANEVIVRDHNIVNSFEQAFYLDEGPRHRELYQARLMRANSGLRRATVSEMS